MHIARILTIAAICLISSLSQAQSFDCSLGRVRERVAPQYPVQLDNHPFEGLVSVLATFGSNGRVTSSKVIAGPQPLRFETESYVRGWIADPSSEIRQCDITVEYRFERSQVPCDPRSVIRLRAEHQDSSHVLMHMSCESW